MKTVQPCFPVCILSALMCGMPVIFIALSISSANAFLSWQKVSPVIWACHLKDCVTGGFCLQNPTAVPTMTAHAEVVFMQSFVLTGLESAGKSTLLIS
ncbi:hypothetical protein [Klebsiella pneumoniae]|uniref:hypothetical protein n=1 Tax=Klebsiella pneumoniae TaxID=573 RepID=UPI00217597AF|nr:hypothetical protein [Klebsiella pneumoniae]MCS5447071.1 hypothetical protein [Klebsiella pneumoniae]